jgi:lambda family phage portal protein
MTIKENFVDKTIRYFDPIKAQRRMHARMMLSLSNAYLGARTDRRQTQLWSTSRGDADRDILSDLPVLRERSRDLIRNNPIATGAENIHVGNIVGRGIKLQSRIKREVLNMSDDEADAWENMAEIEFSIWADTKDCDISRTLTFYDYQSLIVRQIFSNGDTFIITPRIVYGSNPYSLKLQIIEADRVSNKDNKANTQTLSGGVEKDINGAPVSYHIMSQHPGSAFKKSNNWDIVSAYSNRTGLKNVIHLFRTLRPGQSRGVPELTPVIEQLKQLDKYTESELMAAVINSMFTVFIKSPTGDLDIDVSNTTAETGAKTTDDDIKLGSGSIIGLAKGEDISIAETKRPNQNFDIFFQAILRQIGTALEIPFEVLIKHFTASYSASRAALMEAWRFFRQRREWLARHFCQEIYEIWLYEAIAMGRIPAPGFFSDPLIKWAYSRAVWIGDAPIQIDPQKEIGAAEKRIATLLSTVDEETAFITGGDFETNYPRIRKEVEMFRKLRIKHPAEAEQAAVEGLQADKNINSDDGSDSDLETADNKKGAS